MLFTITLKAKGDFVLILTQKLCCSTLFYHLRLKLEWVDSDLKTIGQLYQICCFQNHCTF